MWVMLVAMMAQQAGGEEERNCLVKVEANCRQVCVTVDAVFAIVLPDWRPAFGECVEITVDGASVYSAHRLANSTTLRPLGAL